MCFEGIPRPWRNGEPATLIFLKRTVSFKKIKEWASFLPKRIVIASLFLNRRDTARSIEFNHLKTMLTTFKKEIIVSSALVELRFPVLLKRLLSASVGS